MSESYSKLATFKQCPYKYKLIYLDNHYIKEDTIATEFGTLIHYTEEQIGNCIKNNKPINYDTLLNNFNIQLNILKNKYSSDFFKKDKSNRTYEDKANYYISCGIYRLENRVKKENLKVIALEKEFFVQIKKYEFRGFIDRILYDVSTNEYIIEDIKTYSKAINKGELKAPLQHVIYTLALNAIGIKNIRCAYDLPLCDLIQKVDDNYLNKGINELFEIFNSIKTSDFHPNPTPLCHWCVFCSTYENQPKEAIGLCPYYSLWTKGNRIFSVNHKWLGLKEHKRVLEEFKNKQT